MANYFFTDANGSKQGPYDESQLQRLIARGRVTQTTLVEADTGFKGVAGHIPGLFTTAPPPPVQRGQTTPPPPVQTSPAKPVPPPPSPATRVAQVTPPSPEPELVLDTQTFQDFSVSPPAAAQSPFTHTIQPPSPSPLSFSGNLFCTNCGSPVSEQAVACMSCGATPTGHRRFCRHCGVALNPEQVVCVKCGSAIKTTASPQTIGGSAGGASKSKITAGLLAILIGGLGAHKFYMGSWGWGIIFLVLCWTYIPAIIALIEGIIYLTKSDEAFAEKYPPETQAPFRW